MSTRDNANDCLKAIELFNQTELVGRPMREVIKAKI
jgi:hypothetical protein